MESKISQLENEIKSFALKIDEIQKNFMRAFSNIATALGIEVFENKDQTISWKIIGYQDEKIRGIIPMLIQGHEKLSIQIKKLKEQSTKNKSLIFLPRR